MAWRPNLTPAELLWRAHLQLRHWRGEHNPEKIAFWYGRRDDLLANIEHRDLEEVDPELDAKLTVTNPGIMRAPRATNSSPNAIVRRRTSEEGDHVVVLTDAVALRQRFRW